MKPSIYSNSMNSSFLMNRVIFMLLIHIFFVFLVNYLTIRSHEMLKFKIKAGSKKLSTPLP